ncbi:MAG: NADH-quinone oxidoreductase subunit N [Halothiobacillaceae bacterium]|nr:MAG: NADH-quinone oxidoreductase subunit N [Halothiobacillaceae bacterium]
MASVVLLVEAYRGSRSPWLTYLLTQATLVGALLITLSIHTTTAETTFGGTYIKDAMGDILKAFIYLVAFVVFLYSRRYLNLRGLDKGEYYVLGLFAVLGAMVMVSAHSLLLIYLGLELLSLSLYALVALNRDSSESTEAAMKYFVLGALASGMLLYGMSLFYGATGSLNIPEIATALKMGVDHPIVLKLGLVFIVIGLAFKLGLVPFHMWVPDVYHGSPTSVTLYLGTVPKIAAFGMVMRLLVDGMPTLHVDWQNMLIVLAMLSIAIGNVIAIAQVNIKRMLAYSTISHMGFLVLGILTGTVDGYSSAMFYTLVYALMGLGAFGMIIMLSRAGFEADKIEDFKGLNERSPWLAFITMVLMFSMAGIPPTVGFFAKLAVLQAIVNVGLVWLAVFVVLFSVIGAFYYLRIIKMIYFDKPIDTHPITAGFDMRLTMGLNGVAVLLLGIFPSSLLALCYAALAVPTP